VQPLLAATPVAGSEEFALHPLHQGVAAKIRKKIKKCSNAGAGSASMATKSSGRVLNLGPIWVRQWHQVQQGIKREVCPTEMPAIH